HPCCQQRGASEKRRGAVYAREGPAWKAVICLSRRRHSPAHRWRATQEPRWRRHRPCSLSGRGPHRRDQRACDHDADEHGRDPAAGSRRQAARPCRHVAQALADHFRTANAAESGFPDFEAISWFGLLAPAGTPAAVVSKVHADIVQIAVQADVRERIAQLGLEVSLNSPEEFAVVIKSDTAKWAKVIRAANIKAE